MFYPKSAYQLPKGFPEVMMPAQKWRRKRCVTSADSPNGVYYGLARLKYLTVHTHTLWQCWLHVFDFLMLEKGLFCAWRCLYIYLWIFPYILCTRHISSLNNGNQTDKRSYPSGKVMKTHLWMTQQRGDEVRHKRSYTLLSKERN